MSRQDSLRLIAAAILLGIAAAVAPHLFSRRAQEKHNSGNEPRWLISFNSSSAAQAE
jgi:hypothetical protein